MSKINLPDLADVLRDSGVDFTTTKTWLRHSYSVFQQKRNPKIQMAKRGNKTVGGVEAALDETATEPLKIEAILRDAP